VTAPDFPNPRVVLVAGGWQPALAPSYGRTGKAGKASIAVIGLVRSPSPESLFSQISFEGKVIAPLIIGR
jgi:hypothetical protein